METAEMIAGPSFGEQLESLGFSSYQEYLDSDRWAKFRNRYRTSGRPTRCMSCDCGEYQLHHISYDRVGKESLDDVVPLCGECHRAVHAYSKEKGVSVKHTDLILMDLKGWTIDETIARFERCRESIPRKAPKGDRPKMAGGGYVVVPHAVTALPGMSDAAFRLWVAMDRWAWKNLCPTNKQLALACGWISKAGNPSASKARRMLRQLEGITIDGEPIVRRVNILKDGVVVVREGILVSRTNRVSSKTLP